MIWDNPLAHRGDALRAYLTTPDLHLCLVNLPSYSPDFNADEAVWGWVRQEEIANLCLGTRLAVQEKVGAFSPTWLAVGRRSNGVAEPCFRLA